MEGTIGEIRLFAGNFAPKGWALCQGQTMQIASNQALFAILGAVYGGDGKTTFLLPDLRGRTMVHPDSTHSYNLGKKGGEATHALTPVELPTHTHKGTTYGSMEDGTLNNPLGNHLGSSESLSISMYINSVMGDMAPGSISVDSAGNGEPHQNMQPYLGLNYIVCLYGIFPSRK